MSKMQRTRQGGEVWELLTGIGSGCCQFPFTEFFDSSCYEDSKYGILIAAAMDHRYENSAASSVVQVSVTQGQSRHITEVTSTDLTKSKVMLRVIPFSETVIGADLYKRNWDEISYHLVTTNMASARHGECT